MSPGGGIQEEESWRRNPGGGSQAEGPGGVILEEECWGGNAGGGIQEEESHRRSPRVEILEHES